MALANDFHSRPKRLSTIQRLTAAFTLSSAAVMTAGCGLEDFTNQVQAAAPTSVTEAEDPIVYTPPPSPAVEEARLAVQKAQLEQLRREQEALRLETEKLRLQQEAALRQAKQEVERLRAQREAEAMAQKMAEIRRERELRYKKAELQAEIDAARYGNYGHTYNNYRQPTLKQALVITGLTIATEAIRHNNHNHGYRRPPPPPHYGRPPFYRGR